MNGLFEFRKTLLGVVAGGLIGSVIGFLVTGNAKWEIPAGFLGGAVLIFLGATILNKLRTGRGTELKIAPEKRGQD